MWPSRRDCRSRQFWRRGPSVEISQIHSIGGVRPDGLRWHPDGLALDVMIPDYQSPSSIALGDHIVAFVPANADQLALDHVIWRQTLYLANGTVRRMGDRGSDDANHVTHVHIATNGVDSPPAGKATSPRSAAVPRCPFDDHRSTSARKPPCATADDAVDGGTVDAVFLGQARAVVC